MVSRGRSRVPGRGWSPGKRANCCRTSGLAFTRDQRCPSAETASEGWLRGGTDSSPARARVQFEHPQFHCGSPPPAPDPRTRALIPPICHRWRRPAEPRGPPDAAGPGRKSEVTPPSEAALAGQRSAGSARPALGPGVKRSEGGKKLLPLRGEPVARGFLPGDNPGPTQLPQPTVEDRGRDPAAALLQCAKRLAAFAQLPDKTQGPAPSEEIQQRHDRPAARGSSYR